MKIFLAVLNIFLLFVSSCVTVEKIEEDYTLVLDEIIEYSASGNVISSISFYYNTDGYPGRIVLSKDEVHINIMGMKYNDNGNCTEYHLDNPYTLYRRHFDEEQRLTKIEEYGIKDADIPFFYEIYFYNKKGFYGKYHYRIQDNRKILAAEIDYHFSAGKLTQVRYYSMENKHQTYLVYTYDKTGRKLRTDFHYRIFNNITEYELYEYDSYDRLIQSKKYSKNKALIKKTVYNYKKRSPDRFYQSTEKTLNLYEEIIDKLQRRISY